MNESAVIQSAFVNRLGACLV